MSILFPSVLAEGLLENPREVKQRFENYLKSYVYNYYHEPFITALNIAEDKDPFALFNKFKLEVRDVVIDFAFETEFEVNNAISYIQNNNIARLFMEVKHIVIHWNSMNTLNQIYKFFAFYKPEPIPIEVELYIMSMNSVNDFDFDLYKYMYGLVAPLNNCV